MIDRRRFTSALLSLPTAATLGSRALLAQTPSRPAQEGTPGAMSGWSGTSFTDWPKGFSPAELGSAVAERFAASPHMRPTLIVYPEVCAWYGALEFARVTKNDALLAKLRERFEPLFTTEEKMQPPRGKHVDYSMFGSLPFELYILTQDKRFLDLGLAYADAQWAKPDAQGLTDETRFWIDDMWMVTIVQVQAFRATGDRKYIDRAALEMAAYLDKLQQPNGLFFHAPDVPFFWGRGNGWFAAGMAELLRSLPTDHPQHTRIVRGYRTMMASLRQYQRKDGSWGQLIDHDESWSESSGTGMFAFALVTGVKSGWLDASYAACAHHAWIALAGYVDQNADVTAVCEGTNKYNNLEYYLLRKRKTGDFHGQAPLMWTANALLRA
jgi:rhamnogalacturonyl hydrolase YesR